MWSVYKMDAGRWKNVFKAQSFQHACRVYDDLRAKLPNETFTINFAH